MRRILITTILLLAAGPASANAMRCDESLSPIAMTDCVFRNMGMAEQRLNRLVDRYRQRLDTGKRQLFDLSQNEWKEYMIRACEFEASAALGGSAYPTIIGLCRTRLMHERRLAVLKLYQCREGQLNCPAPDPNAPDADDDEE